MPLYKYVGNRILTTVRERGRRHRALREWHSRLPRLPVDALRRSPFERNTDGFDFDTQIILQLHRGREAHRRGADPDLLRRRDLPRQRACGYARDVTRRRRCATAPHKMGFGAGELAFDSEAVRAQGGPGQLARTASSRWLGDRPAGRVLDLGCADGAAGRAPARRGPPCHRRRPRRRTRASTERLDRFVEADLDAGIPPRPGAGYDVVARRRRARARASTPSGARRDRRRVLRAGRLAGRQRAELRPLVPAAAGGARAVRLRPARHPRPRPPALLHPPQLRAAAAARGSRAAWARAVGLPFDAVGRRAGAAGCRCSTPATLRVWPTLFGYQFILEASADHDREGGQEERGGEERERALGRACRSLRRPGRGSAARPSDRA